MCPGILKMYLLHAKKSSHNTEYCVLLTYFIFKTSVKLWSKSHISKHYWTHAVSIWQISHKLQNVSESQVNQVTHRKRHCKTSNPSMSTGCVSPMIISICWAEGRVETRTLGNPCCMVLEVPYIKTTSIQTSH